MTKIKVDIETAKAMLTMDEALDLLAPHKEGKKLRVHTFTGGAFLMGCDMDLTEIKKRLKKCASDEITLSGPNMKAMGHAVAYWDEKYGWTFLETDKAKIETIHQQRKIK